MVLLLTHIENEFSYLQANDFYSIMRVYLEKMLFNSIYQKTKKLNLAQWKTHVLK